MDFYQLRTKRTKEGLFVYPDFIVQSSKDLLIKGRSFYALWDEDKGLWSRDEMDVARVVDADLRAKAEEMDAIPMLMSSYESKSWTSWKNYVNTLDDSEHDLDLTLTFADTPVDRKKYASRRLPYNLIDAPCPAWDELIGTLYDKDERDKLEWAIGSIISGESKKNQKFVVIYGAPGSGKSTIMGVMEKLFEGYYVPFDAKSMTSASNAFALTGFKHNPLLAIQHDGDLSRIEDNTRLNSIVSHELLPINEKFKSEYYARAYAFLFLGTNEPVKISGSKSGIIRRLIDVHPSGRLIPNKHYHALLSQIDFELGAIANHCLGVYYALGKNYYSGYRPTTMMYETDVFYNYVEYAYDLFYTQDGVTLERAWQLYKEFCEDSLVKHRLQRHQFRAELASYFEKFEERPIIDGQRLRNYFSGFKTHRFIKADETVPISLSLENETSILDEVLAEQPAQYATEEGVPKYKWDNVKQKLKQLDTSKLHYVKVPEKHIVIDFDLKDEHGVKSRERNLEAAAEWPPTYAEYSQGGGGIHLHYYYDGPGNIVDLNPVHSDGIEVKSLTGNSSLRRRHTRSNGLPITTITSGLAFKEESSMQDAKAMSNEKTVRNLIIRNLRKEIHPGTKPSIDFIEKILEDAYISKIPYDVSDLYPDVYAFAMDSTNHARECIDIVKKMHFMSEDMELKTEAGDDRIAFFDVEIFPNLFVLCWKFAGDSNVVKMINPTPVECEEVLKLKLIGYNCRRYDNHILYARAIGCSIPQLYDISQRIVEHKDKSAMFGAAYDLSYTDIYEFASKKQSLKKWEIDLGLKHSELGLRWNEDVPKELWDKVADYCCDDVVATEQTFDHLEGDWTARKILAKLSGLSVNHTTQQHTARIIFGTDRRPQKEFLYTDLAEMFPGYEFDFGKSTYQGEVVGEGGYVYAEPGYYRNVALLDVASMHPTSIELLDLFGPYTERFSDLKKARICIKRGDYDSARRMFEGKLGPFLEDEDKADDLSYALKIAINIVYGLTSAKFENAFRDPRNNDNIVAKRGALFMIDLKKFVQDRGFTVAHIKTDSIKIPNATEEIIDDVMKFGAKYGYEFEHEATYDEFVLFNDAVYIAKYGWAAKEKLIGTWAATGAQFLHPYVFKTLITGEEIVFRDLCETRNVVKGEIFIDKEGERRFVGRIGSFVPVVEGAGGGTLLRVAEVDGEKRDYAVTGTKGWLWLEAETVQELGLEDKIDYSYFDTLVEKAKKAMEEVGYPI